MDKFPKQFPLNAILRYYYLYYRFYKLNLKMCFALTRNLIRRKTDQATAGKFSPVCSVADPDPNFGTAGSEGGGKNESGSYVLNSSIYGKG